MSKSLRAKFYCNQTEDDNMVRLSAVYGNSEKDNKENNEFAEATPYGELKMQVDNPDAQGFFKEGKEYYLDITEAPEN